MAINFTPVKDEIVTAIGTIWPEVKPEGHGIIPFSVIQRLDFEDLTPAFAVLDWGPVPLSDDPQAVSNAIFVCEVLIHYVGDRAATELTIAPKLEALADHFETNRLANAAYQGITGYDWSDGNRVNQIWMRAQRPYWGGSVGIGMLLGETP